MMQKHNEYNTGFDTFEIKISLILNEFQEASLSVDDCHHAFSINLLCWCLGNMTLINRTEEIILGKMLK